MIKTIKWKTMFPTYTEFKDFFSRIDLDFTNPNVELFYNWVSNKYDNRWLKSVSPTSILAICQDPIINAYYIYNQYKILKTQDPDFLLKNTQENTTYGLGGIGATFKEEEKDDYIFSKNLNEVKENKLDNIQKLKDVSNKYTSEIEKSLGKMFLPFIEEVEEEWQNIPSDI